MSNKLYLVKCRGMQKSIVSDDFVNEVAYVVASYPTEAYNKLRSFLDKKNIGFESERERFIIDILTEDDEYPDCGTRLFL